MIKKINQNCGPEKPSKNDAPGISFGTKNRQELMLLRPKIAKIAQKSSFLKRRFFDDFSGCQKPIFLLILGPPGKKYFHIFSSFFDRFSHFSRFGASLAILGDFSCPRRPEMSKNDEKNKPNHQACHQFLATSHASSHTTSVEQTRPHELT